MRVTAIAARSASEHQLVAPKEELLKSITRTRYLKPSATKAKETAEEDIAIIGINGIFPGSPDLDVFWQHLETQKDLISEIPKDRWDWHEYYGEGKINKTKVKWGGFINDIDKFDAAFFAISPREAELMDPQHRLFLETVWKTIEDAGYDPYSLSNQKVGLFVGVQFNEYQELLALEHENQTPMQQQAIHMLY